MKHSAQISQEFAKIAISEPSGSQWSRMSLDAQREYLRRHPKSMRKLTPAHRQFHRPTAEEAQWFKTRRLNAIKKLTTKFGFEPKQISRFVYAFTDQLGDNGVSDAVQRTFFSDYPADTLKEKLKGTKFENVKFEDLQSQGLTGEAIDYGKTEVNDTIAKLQSKISGAQLTTQEEKNENRKYIHSMPEWSRKEMEKEYGSDSFQWPIAHRPPDNDPALKLLQSFLQDPKNSSKIADVLNKDFDEQLPDIIENAIFDRVPEHWRGRREWI